MLSLGLTNFPNHIVVYPLFAQTIVEKSHPTIAMKIHHTTLR